MRETSKGGAWKVCPQCGRTFFVHDVGSYTYKRYVRENGRSALKQFCRYSCMLSFDREKEERKKKREESDD